MLASTPAFAAGTPVLNFDSNTPIPGAWVIGTRLESGGMEHSPVCAEVAVTKSDAQGKFELSPRGFFDHFTMYFFYRKGYWQTWRRTATGGNDYGLSMREAQQFAGLDPTTGRIEYLNEHAQEMSCAYAPREQRAALLAVFRDMYAEARELAKTSEQALRARTLCAEMFRLSVAMNQPVFSSDTESREVNAYLRSSAPECLEPIDDGEQQRFVQAFERSDLESMARLAKEGFDVNRLVFDNNPAIVMAARYGDPQRITALASLGAKLDLVGTEHETALSLTVKSYSLARPTKLATVKALLEGGADPNLRDPVGFSPILDVVRSGDLELLTLMLDHHGNPNQTVECRIYCLDQHRSALAFARSAPVTELLIQRGASVSSRDANGNSLLDYDFPLDVVKLLISAGADVNAADAGGWTPLMHKLQSYAQIPIPVRQAAYREIAITLVKSGARLDLKNQWGKDALYYSKDEALNRELRQLAAHR
jgi:ankyrin repeat protein